MGSRERRSLGSGAFLRADKGYPLTPGVQRLVIALVLGLSLAAVLPNIPHGARARVARLPAAERGVGQTSGDCAQDPVESGAGIELGTA